MAKEDCITEIYKGIILRGSNTLRFRVSDSKFKEILDIVELTGFSIPKVISISNRPCEKCKGQFITVLGKDGNEVKIKRGILSEHNMMNSGTNIIQQNKNKPLS